jgi:hypothetical protein
MSPLGGWDGQPIQGTAGTVEDRPRRKGAIPAMLEDAPPINARVAEMREREARFEQEMERVDPQSPRHKQMERVLVAARKKRKRLEREAKKG